MEAELHDLRARAAETEKELQAIRNREGPVVPSKEMPSDWDRERMRLLMRAEKAETRAKKVGGGDTAA